MDPAPDPVRAFVAADSALNAVVQQIRDEQWDMTMPPEFAMRSPHATVTLREIINYHAYDEAWIPYSFAGKRTDEASPAQPGDDVLGADPRAAFDALVRKGIAAVKGLTDLDQPVHFSYGDFPAREALWHVISFRGLRAVDIARVIGVDDTLDAELVQAMWDAFLPEAETWRAMGVFGPKVEVADAAPLQERLLGLTGRPPRRTG